MSRNDQTRLPQHLGSQSTPESNDLYTPCIADGSSVGETTLATLQRRLSSWMHSERVLEPPEQSWLYGLECLDFNWDRGIVGRSGAELDCRRYHAAVDDASERLSQQVNDTFKNHPNVYSFGPEIQSYIGKMTSNYDEAIREALKFRLQDAPPIAKPTQIRLVSEISDSELCPEVPSMSIFFEGGITDTAAAEEGSRIVLETKPMWAKVSADRPEPSQWNQNSDLQRTASLWLEEGEAQSPSSSPSSPVAPWKG